MPCVCRHHHRIDEVGIQQVTGGGQDHARPCLCSRGNRNRSGRKIVDRLNRDCSRRRGRRIDCATVIDSERYGARRYIGEIRAVAVSDRAQDSLISGNGCQTAQRQGACSVAAGDAGTRCKGQDIFRTTTRDRHRGAGHSGAIRIRQSKCRGNGKRSRIFDIGCICNRTGQDRSVVDRSHRKLNRYRGGHDLSIRHDHREAGRWRFRTIVQERHPTGRHVGHGETGRVHAIDLHRTIDRTRCREGQDIRGVEIGIADISSRQSNTRAFDNRRVQITGQRRSIILNQDLDCHGNRRALQTVVGGIGQRGRSRRIARKGDGIASAGRSANEACGVERPNAEGRQRSIRVDVVGEHIQLRG